MTQTITLSSVSQAVTTRKVEARLVNGRVVGIFRRIDFFGDRLMSPILPIRGDLEKLATFAARQPGLFAKWVDSKFGIK